MNSLETFHCTFGDTNKCSQLMVMPLIMTLAARHAGVRYIDYLRDPYVMALAQLAVCQDFGMDVLATTSDPVSELSAMGGDLVWFDNDPPAPDPMRPLLAEKRDLNKLGLPDPRGSNRMGVRSQAIREMKLIGDGRYPVLGWVEGPISLAAVMRGMSTLMEDLIDDEEFIDELFSFCVDIAISYAEAQIEAGADMIGFGDAPASLIGPSLYDRFVLPNEKRMISAIKALGVPVRMHICGNTTKLLHLMAESGADLIDIDSITDLAAAAHTIPHEIHLLGNLDPVREVLYSEPIEIKARLKECQRIVGDRYVVGAGCEIPAKTPNKNLLAFSEFARSNV